jgi:hypothetical protein
MRKKQVLRFAQDDNSGLQFAYEFPRRSLRLGDEKPTARTEMSWVTPACDLAH